MSVVIETLIMCDGGPECPEDGPYAAGDARHDSAKAQRTSYRNDGWRFIKGKDYCPACVKRRHDIGKRS